jgi:SH3-like domain-containing protein
MGDKGTIVGGPVNIDGEKYWQVKFEDGSTGWMKESDIANLPQKLTPMTQMSSLIGTPVETSREVSVYSAPGEGEIKKVPAGSKATILEGPMIKDGVKYWHVRFDDGTEGWVSEDALDSMLDGKRTPLSKMPSLIGGSVATNKNGTKLYSSPGGELIGTVNNGVSGEILEGPIVVDGVRYFHVKFDNGMEGWVSENDLNYVEEVEPNALVKTLSFIFGLFKFIKYTILLLAVFLSGLIAYLYRAIVKLRKEERERMYPNGVKERVEEKPMINPRWNKVLDGLNSPNESDWRLAIMEADIMLYDLLEKMSLPGETIGDKLKAVDPSDFLTLDNAWEAHRVRNQIAHDGAEFKLTDREAKRVVALYMTVFEEFGIIEK